MTRAQGLLVVLMSVLLLAWLAVGGGAPQPHAANAERPRLPADARPATIGEHEARLRARLSAATPLPPSRRNPFEFGASGVGVGRARSARVSPAANALPIAQEERPAMQLLGIAEDPANGRTVRTAIVSAAGQLFCVREGERVLGRYEVVRVGADAVELKDGSARFTLALK